MKSRYLFLFLAVTSGLTLAQAPAASQTDDTKPSEPPATRSFDPTAMDLNADPCQDFYQYACGNWTKNNSIPADQTRWVRSFSLLQQRNQYLLWKDLDSAASAPKNPLQKQYGDFYASCMDTDAIEKLGLEPIQPAWKQIASLTDAKQLPGLLGRLEDQGAPDGFFQFRVGQDEKDSSKQIAEVAQGGISLPDRDYYLVDSPHFAQIRAQYVEHIKKMFALAGDTPEQAAKEAAAVMEIETAMAKASISRVERRNPDNVYHIYTVDDFQKVTPDFDWQTYLHAVGIGHFDTLNVATPDFFKELATLVQTEPLDSWKSYLRWQVLHGHARALPKAFFDEELQFLLDNPGRAEGASAALEQCTIATDRALGEAVGQDWVKENFPPAAKASMDKLVAALDKALADDIKTLPWMSDRDQESSRGKAGHVPQQNRLPRKVARLLQRESEPRRIP